jgi:complex iron-sulfur molybdoenzyme family reductase subunit gamma
VETLKAAGFGTLTGRPPLRSPARGRGRHERGFWEVVLMRPLTVGDGLVALTEGTVVNLAFAIWNGSAGDRNGEKNVTIWHRLAVE